MTRGSHGWRRVRSRPCRATAASLGFEHGMAGVIRAALRVQRRLRRVSRELPLIRAYPPALGRDRAPLRRRPPRPSLPW